MSLHSDVETGSCEGMADFVIVWRNLDNKWQITRVLSFGHRPIEAPKFRPLQGVEEITGGRHSRAGP